MSDDGSEFTGWTVACSVYNDGRLATSVQAMAEAEGRSTDWSRPMVHMKPEFRDEWRIMLDAQDWTTFYAEFDADRLAPGSAVHIVVRSQGRVVKSGTVMLDPYPTDESDD